MEAGSWEGGSLWRVWGRPELGSIVGAAALRCLAWAVLREDWDLCWKWGK